MDKYLMGFEVKDLIIFLALVILVICLRQIRKLKKTLAAEIQKRLLPLLSPEIVISKDWKENGLYLKNDSYFIAQHIKIEDVTVVIDDYGFKMTHIIKFGEVDYLKPNESKRLDFKIFNKEGDFQANVTESAVPHLVSPAFSLKVSYANIEGVRFFVTYLKKREKFLIQKIEYGCDLGPGEGKNKDKPQ
ncbi:MAG: hypothetical protein AB1481_00265 [Candidatus Omnitrophota bacterium]